MAMHDASALTATDRGLLNEIAAAVRRDPGAFRKGGEHLEAHYSCTALARQRMAELRGYRRERQDAWQRGEGTRYGPVVRDILGCWRWSRQGDGNRRDWPIVRLQEGLCGVLGLASDLPLSSEIAQAICLLAWVLSDSESDAVEPRPTEFAGLPMFPADDDAEGFRRARFVAAIDDAHGREAHGELLDAAESAVAWLRARGHWPEAERKPGAEKERGAPRDQDTKEAARGVQTHPPADPSGGGTLDTGPLTRNENKVLSYLQGLALDASGHPGAEKGPTICTALSKVGVSLGDDELRRIMSKLKKRGLADSRRGRGYWAVPQAPEHPT